MDSFRYLCLALEPLPNGGANTGVRFRQRVRAEMDACAMCMQDLPVNDNYIGMYT